MRFLALQSQVPVGGLEGKDPGPLSHGLLTAASVSPPSFTACSLWQQVRTWHQPGCCSADLGTPTPAVGELPSWLLAP